MSTWWKNLHDNPVSPRFEKLSIVVNTLFAAIALSLTIYTCNQTTTVKGIKEMTDTLALNYKELIRQNAIQVQQIDTLSIIADRSLATVERLEDLYGISLQQNRVATVNAEPKIQTLGNLHFARLNDSVVEMTIPVINDGLRDAVKVNFELHFFRSQGPAIWYAGTQTSECGKMMSRRAITLVNKILARNTDVLFTMRFKLVIKFKDRLTNKPMNEREYFYPGTTPEGVLTMLPELDSRTIHLMDSLVKAKGW